MNNQVAIYVALNWVAVLCYVGATIANTAGVVFRKEKLERYSFVPVWLGLAVHSATIIYWWRIVGHGPYLAPSEVLASDAWMVMAVYLVFLWRFPRIRVASVVVFPVVFMMLALANIYNPGIRALPPTFGGVWLLLHIAFYKIALGTLVVGLAWSIFYLRKKRSATGWHERLPELDVIDTYAYRFAGFGFIFWGIAMLAGSVWAYWSWGRYWGWDPVETWSLVAWLLFGVYLHLRRFFRLRGEGAAWLYICCFLLSIIAYYVTSHMGSSVHAEYFK